MHATSVPCTSSSTFSAVRRRKNQRSIGLHICISSSPADLSPARQRSSNEFSVEFASIMGPALLGEPHPRMGGFFRTAASSVPCSYALAVPFPSARAKMRRSRPILADTGAQSAARYDFMLLPLLVPTSRFSHINPNNRPPMFFVFLLRTREELSMHG